MWHQLAKGLVEFLGLLVEFGDTRADLSHLLLALAGISAAFRSLAISALSALRRAFRSSASVMTARRRWSSSRN